MAKSMAASHAVDRKLFDPIFEAGQLCKEAIKQHGAENVTNATIGTVIGEDGKLSVLPVVERVWREMQMTDFTTYAPISGVYDYLDSIYEIVFGSTHYEGFFSSVATPGGTGAIHHAIANYAERGEKVLGADWCWGTYRIICQETGKTYETFKLFNDELTGFNVENFADRVEKILKEQNSLLIILNTPAHNPTGYALTGEEWDKVIEIMKSHAAKGKKISLLVDIAYIEFAGDKETSWAFLDKFGKIPENILLLVAFSMSKSYTLYGQRCGALAAFSIDHDVMEEFEETNKFSCRATWSNINHGAQILLNTLYRKKALRQELADDQAKLRDLVNSRAKIFVDEAEECGLKIVPYKGGFFIAVPADNPAAVAEELHKDLIYAVPLKYGLRVAACSVPLAKMPGVAAKVKAAIERVK